MVFFRIVRFVNYVSSMVLLASSIVFIVGNLLLKESQIKMIFLALPWLLALFLISSVYGIIATWKIFGAVKMRSGFVISTIVGLAASILWFLVIVFKFYPISG